MSANTTGEIFRVTTFGESHGPYMGAVIDGCPPGVELDEEHICTWTDRRRPGQSHITTDRTESDIPEIISGVHKGVTLGTPIAVLVKNNDHRPQDYDPLVGKFRPSHADFTYYHKYRHIDWRGGGRASARETIGRVIGGAIAFRVLQKLCPALKTSVYTKSVGKVYFNESPQIYDHKIIYTPENKLRCPDLKIGAKMQKEIEDAKNSGDSVGCVVEFVFHGLPVGLGEPVFDKLTGTISKAMMSLPASRGIEIGIGFEASRMRGSEHNDTFTNIDGRIQTVTNKSGGVMGGMSTGAPVYGRVAFKPLSTIARNQNTIDIYGEPQQISGKQGRHDPCVASRVTSIVETALASVILDHVLRNYSVQSVNCDFSRFNSQGTPDPKRSDGE